MVCENGSACALINPCSLSALTDPRYESGMKECIVIAFQKGNKNFIQEGA